jgi:hypothetical protein
MGSTGATGPAFSGTLTSALTVQQIAELVTPLASPATTLSVSWTSGGIYYLTGLTGNIALTVTDLPITINQNYTLSFYIVQGATGYYINSLTLSNASASTVTPMKFPGAIVPSPTPSILAVQTFTLYYSAASTWTALSQFTNFA